MLFKNTWKLYEWISKNPKKVILEMAWDLGWSHKKVQRHLNKLVKDGVVKMEKRGTDCLYFLTPWTEFIDWDEMNFLKKGIL